MNTVSQLVNEFSASCNTTPAYWLSLRVAGAFTELAEIEVSDKERIEFFESIDYEYPLIWNSFI